MDAPRQPREEDVDWVSSQFFLIRTQLSALAERMEALQQAYVRMQGILEARAKKESHNKCSQPTPILIIFETLDD